MSERENVFQNPKDPTINELVHWFQVNFPALANDMKASNHNAAADEPNPYHIEDTVWTHTMMVCLRAENENSNKIVKLAALLHDIGKPEARDIIPFEAKKPVHTESNDKRNKDKDAGKDSGMQRKMPKSGLKTHFRGHEGLSFYRAIEVVNKLESEGVLNYQEKQDLLMVISLHGTLFDNIKEGKEVKPEKVISRFGDKIQLYRDFVEQVRNDSTGRFFSSTDGRKNQAWELGRSIFNDSTFYTHMKHPIPKSGPTIFVLVGVPACGKSTWREKNITEDDVVISRDDFMMKYAEDNGLLEKTIACGRCKGSGKVPSLSFHGAGEDGKDSCSKCNSVGKVPVTNYSQVWKYLEENDLHKEVDKIEQEVFKKAVKDRKNIIVDRTNMSKKSRRKWLSNVPKDYNKVAVVFATVYEDIYSRNKKRAEDTGKYIGNHIIGNMMRQFIVPTYDEVDTITWVF